ncbi:alpha/beta hydrolase [Radiobacillus sp. PE A8.2]|uniref:alpha/beta hydrolase n=1 Tax=Radiobacillus sp. PE A8.2 TaxID=3380349 RepID=UPI00388E9431
MGRKGKMIERQLNSSYLDETMTIKCYLPEVFTPLGNYHICIMQDGDDYFRMGRVATVSDKLHDDGEIEPTVFVGIHYNDKYDRKEKYHPTGSKQKAYIDFLVREVVPLLDEEIPSDQVGASRTLMGDSLAGTLALQTAITYPQTFGKIIMQSPYVDNTVLEMVERADTSVSLSIYHTIGTDETVVEMSTGGEMDFLTPNRKLEQLLSHKPFNYSYYELDGPHTWKPWQTDLPRALTSMFG